MKKPIVDYRKFRLNKLNDPEFSHLKYLFGWVGYFILYFLTENLIPRENCFVLHSRVDDIIPFCEYFVIPYVGWYLLIIFSLLYFALYNTNNFRALMKFIIATQIIAMAIYIIFPNCQNLRPAEFPRENTFSNIVGILYSFDTSTNVCPSLHVAYSIGIISVFIKEKGATKILKAFIVIFSLLVCASVLFVKQHSFWDVIAALPVCLIAEIIAFKGYYKKRFFKS